MGGAADRFAGRGWQALVLLLAVLLFGTRLDGIDLWAPDEPRYAQVAEEIRAFESGPTGLVLLSLNGQPYDQKPPLYFWLAALAGAPGGRVTETAARLPSAIAGAALAGLLLVFGRRLVGGGPATVGAALLVTSALFAHVARRAQLDVVLTLFESLALAAFWRLDHGEGKRRTNLALLHASMGLGVLTKGPVGFLVPAAVIAAFLAWEGRLREIRKAFPLRALALSLLPAVAWIALATLLGPEGFFHGAVVDNLYGRFFLGTSKVNPWYYYFGAFPADFLPWTLLWPLVFLVARREIFAPGAPDEPRRAWRFLLAWVGATFVFFSVSSGKRDLYLLTCYPAAALLCGDAAVRALGERSALPRWAIRVVAGAAIALAAAAAVVTIAAPAPDVDVPLVFCAGVLAALLAGALVWRYAAPAAGALGQLAAIIFTVACVELACVALLFPAIDVQKSLRPVADAVAAVLPPGEPIGLVEQRPAVGGLVYYSGRRVVEIGPAENLRGYFDRGGAAAVVRADAFVRVRGEDYAEIRARVRSGKREVLVVTPRASTAAPLPR